MCLPTPPAWFSVGDFLLSQFITSMTVQMFYFFTNYFCQVLFLGDYLFFLDYPICSHTIVFVAFCDFLYFFIYQL